MRARVRHRAELLRRQDGVALVMAVLILAVLTVVGVAIVSYTSSNSRNASLSKESTRAHGLAEAGIAEGLAKLTVQTNPYDPDILPATTSTYPDGTVDWSGTFDQPSSSWTITATASVANPTGPGASDVQRTVEAVIEVTRNVSSPSNNAAWNYIYSTRTGNTCDMVIEQSTDVRTPVYVEGNLCFQNTAKMTDGTLIVKNQLFLTQPQNRVGSNGDPIDAVYVANGCKYRNFSVHSPCQGLPGNADNVWADTIGTTGPALTLPAIDWDERWLNSNPGPNFPCYTTAGTPPVFDNDGARNNSLGETVFHLTPGFSYTCWTAGGELSWDAVTRVLTVAGTIFIDGSAEINNGELNTYQGQAVLYLSGTMLIKNSEMCAVADSNSCDTGSWDPNGDILIIAANGSGQGQLNDGNSIELVSAQFQGGLIGTNIIDINTSSAMHGPMWGPTVVIGQTVVAEFPPIDILPSGSPGYPPQYGFVLPPKIYG